MLNEETCIECIDQLNELPLRYADNDFPLIKEAYRLAAELGVAIYDAVYIALAKQTGATIITADRKVFNKVKDRGNIQLLTFNDE